MHTEWEDRGASRAQQFLFALGLLTQQVNLAMSVTQYDSVKYFCHELYLKDEKTKPYLWQVTNIYFHFVKKAQ